MARGALTISPRSAALQSSLAPVDEESRISGSLALLLAASVSTRSVNISMSGLQADNESAVNDERADENAIEMEAASEALLEVALVKVLVRYVLNSSLCIKSKASFSWIFFILASYKNKK